MAYQTVARPPVRRRRRKRSRMPRVIAGLAILVAVLLVCKGVLEGWWGQRQPPETPEWVSWEPLALNPYSRPGTPLEQVNGIVVHYVGTRAPRRRRTAAISPALRRRERPTPAATSLSDWRGRSSSASPWTRWPTAPTSAMRTLCPSSAAIRTGRGSLARPPTTPW